MHKTLTLWLSALILSLPLAAADFAFQAGSAPPDAIPEAARSMLLDGVQAKGPDGAVIAEFWMRKTPFDGEGKKDLGVRYPSIPAGAFLGVVHYPAAASDYRAQEIPSGYYTLRYELQPVDGNHYEPTRDFALLSPVDKDTDVAANIDDFDAVVDLSYEVGNPHVTIVHIELSEGMDAPNLWENDYGHHILDLKVAEDVVGFVVAGHAEE